MATFFSLSRSGSGPVSTGQTGSLPQTDRPRPHCLCHTLRRDFTRPHSRAPPVSTRTRGHSTFKLDGEAGQAHGGIASKRQEKAVAAALESLRGLGALEAANQGAVGAVALIDVQEVIAGLHVEAESKGHGCQHLAGSPRISATGKRRRAEISLLLFDFLKLGPFKC